MGNWFELQLSCSFFYIAGGNPVCDLSIWSLLPIHLSPHIQTLWFQLNGSLLGPNVSKHTVISHQHQSKLLWFSSCLEKEEVLYFPSAICSCLLSAAADIPSLQVPFSWFPLQSENFSQAVLFAILKECILQAQASLFCSSKCNWNKIIWPQSFEKCGRAITEQTNKFIMFCDICISFSYLNT